MRARGILARWCGALALLLVAVLPGLAADAKKPARPAPAPTLAKLAWLAGAWRMEKGGRVVDEHWMLPAGGVMLGMGRTVAKGRELEHEFMQIREGPGGELFFVAQPAGQESATFKLATLTDSSVVFENKEHDFPQTIGYALQADGTVLAVVEGLAPGGAAKRVEFSYHKMP